MEFEAMRIVQPSGREVFAFPSTAAQILEIAIVPRIGRDGNERLIGYQRPELAKHISSIQEYLEDDDAVLPNTIVIAFSEGVRFTPHGVRGEHNGAAEFGTLRVPKADPVGRLPGFVVDGQQRLAAMASCSLPDFPVFVTALISPSVEDQRKQFVLVNRTRSLPIGLVFELLPEIDGVFPKHLMDQKLAATVVTRLNVDRYSPLYHKIRTPTCPDGHIKDNSIRRMVLNSLSDGALFKIARQQHEPTDLVHSACRIVSEFWTAVTEVFPTASTLPARKSRLTHGVGVIALGYVMDHVYMEQPAGQWQAQAITQALELLRPYCAWTKGTWDFGEAGTRPWNDLQNVSKDIRLLATYFQRILRAETRE